MIRVAAIRCIVLLCNNLALNCIIQRKLYPVTSNVGNDVGEQVEWIRQKTKKIWPSQNKPQYTLVSLPLYSVAFAVIYPTCWYEWQAGPAEAGRRMMVWTVGQVLLGSISLWLTTITSHEAQAFWNDQKQRILFIYHLKHTAKETSQLRVNAPCERNHRSPVDSPHKGQVMGKRFYARKSAI